MTMSTQDVVAASGADVFSRATALTAADTHRQFRIALPDVPVGHVEVESLESEAHAVNDDYVFRVKVCTLAPLTTETLLGAPVTLALGLDPQPARVHGLVAEIEEQGDRFGLALYVIHLRSPLSLLSGRVDHRVFRRRTAADIARDVLDTALDGVADVVIEADEEMLPSRDMVVQNNESDLDFLRRMLARDGLLMVLRQGDERAAVVVCDALAGAAEPTGDWPLELAYVRPSGQVRTATNTVFALTDRLVEQPARVEVRDFDPAHPGDTSAARAHSEVDADGGGVRLYGQSAGDHAARSRHAGLVQSGYDARRREVTVRTGSPLLAPGVRVRITGHPRERANGTYVVVEATHEGDQAAAIHGGDGSGRPTYECTARLVPAAVVYRDVPEARAADTGVLAGRVEAASSDHADLDDEGAYRVRLDLDDGDADNAAASPRVRLMQPYGGSRAGMHFPIQGDTRVAMAGLNGDADRPVILGALPHAGQHPPVTGENPHQHVLRTPAGHALSMDDNPDHPQLTLSGARNAGRLDFSAHHDQRRVALTTAEGDMEIGSGHDMTVRAGGSRTIEVEGNYTVSAGSDLTLHAEQGEGALSAAEAIHLTTESGDLLQEATDGSAMLRANADMVMEAEEQFTVIAKQGDAVLAADAGAIQLEAAGDLELTTAGGDITLGAGLTIRDNGDLVLDGERIEINARQITLSADDVTEN